jgi:two-component system phosphate regulon response regulator PhoB
MTHEASILVIEDESDIAELIRYNLENAGFTVTLASDGRVALGLAQSLKPDLILLDWMLPHMSGIDICGCLRENPDTREIPIILLTARGEEHDKIVGLNAGADDYVTKPFSPAELVARIRAVLRRSLAKASSHARVLTHGDLVMDFARRRVTQAGTEIRLGPTEFKMLHHFLRHPGEVFSREQLLELVWDKDIYVEPRTVDVHIRRLRKALGDDGDAETGLIRTVRSAGYALNVLPSQSSPSNNEVER